MRKNRPRRSSHVHFEPQNAMFSCDGSGAPGATKCYMESGSSQVLPRGAAGRAVGAPSDTCLPPRAASLPWVPRLPLRLTFFPAGAPPRGLRSSRPSAPTGRRAEGRSERQRIFPGGAEGLGPSRITSEKARGLLSEAFSIGPNVPQKDRLLGRSAAPLISSLVCVSGY